MHISIVNEFQIPHQSFKQMNTKTDLFTHAHFERLVATIYNANQMERASEQTVLRNTQMMIKASR